MEHNDIVSTDVLIVGGGASGLATAIHLADILEGSNCKILLIEKGNSIGSHILSGAVIKADIFRDLLPDIDFSSIPLNAKVIQDKTVYLTENGSFKLPFHPPYMNNMDNYTASLGQICKFLATVAKDKGVEIYTGFSVDEILYKDGKVCGAKTKDTGIDHHGAKLENFQAGTQIEAKVTVFAEGSRGYLTQKLINKFKLDEGKNKQVYSLGVKELWSVTDGSIKAGEVYHTMGYPLSVDEFGGGFIYGLNDNKVAIGLVVGLDYKDPTFDIHGAFQVWKQNPFVSKILKGGKMIEFGAKTLPEGGYFSLPKLYVDNALIVGDGAGFITMPALKGVHLAIKSGMLAGVAIADALEKNDTSAKQLSEYEKLINSSLIKDEMYPVRNFRAGFNNGLFRGALNFSTQLLTSGAGLFGKLQTHEDRDATIKLKDYDKLFFKERFEKRLEFDKVLTFDKATDVYFSKASHDEEQLVHLQIDNPASYKEVNIKLYGAPCVAFCPAEVYELHTDKSGHQELRIHAENCVHCKTCDIKSPNGAISWVVPNGGNGPDYDNM
ncbi:MAG: electron transfer flavoprotein [Sulfurovum sp. AS07-7]|nr:MAG: electron transfer flavoprotein [Sulfurovum sp. AS07-7]